MSLWWAALVASWSPISSAHLYFSTENRTQLYQIALPIVGLLSTFSESSVPNTNLVYPPELKMSSTALNINQNKERGARERHNGLRKPRTRIQSSTNRESVVMKIDIKEKENWTITLKMKQELNSGAWWRMTMVKMTLLIAVMPTLLFQLFPVITLFWSVQCFLWPLRVRGPTQFGACNKLPLAATLSAAVRRQLWAGLSCARLQNPRVSVTEREYYLSRVSQHATRPQSSSDCPLIIPFTSRRIETYRPWKETVWLGCEYSEPKSPTGKLDFLSNLWALEPSTARGHGGGRLCSPAIFCLFAPASF